MSSTDCLSNKHRRWPEDIAWHPHGKKLFSVYSADNGDSQISILNLNKGKEVASLSEFIVVIIILILLVCFYYAGSWMLIGLFPLYYPTPFGLLLLLLNLELCYFVFLLPDHEWTA